MFSKGFLTTEAKDHFDHFEKTKKIEPEINNDDLIYKAGNKKKNKTYI